MTMMLPEQMTTTLPGQNDDDAIRADDELMMVLQEQTTIGHGDYEATETDDDVDTGANNIGQHGAMNADTMIRLWVQVTAADDESM